MVDDSAMTFGDKLKILAKARGLSRDAILAGVASRGVELSKSALGNYFADLARPQLGTALALARVLGVPLDFLADDAMEDMEVGREDGGISPEERAVVAIYRHRRRVEGVSFSPEELAWRCEVPRYADAPAISAGDTPRSEGKNQAGADATGPGAMVV